MAVPGMERLVEMFVQSARYGASGEASSLSAVPADGGHLDADGIEHGIAAIEKMMQSDDGIRMGVDPAATFVCLAMALEEKPLLQAAAVRCYERGLECLDKIRKRKGKTEGSWERATVLQQLGMCCLRQNRAKDATRWLDECSEECVKTEGHPSEAVLFGGAFNTKQTRLDFVGTVEKILAKVYHALGDEERSRKHYEEVQRLSRLQSCDAVERAEAQSESREGQQPKDTSAQTSARPKPSPNDPKVLWATTPAEERQVSEYRFVDEGSTVLLMWDLNDHLGIGEEASNSVSALSQFRVNCESDSVNVRLRLRRENGLIAQFQLLLEPLVNEIIPEDTVPKLKGREGKRRLEVKLFKKDKARSWYNDMVKSSVKPKATTTGADKQGRVDESARGTMLNPLSADELAKLPRPAGSGGDNRPSSWQSGPTPLHKEEAPIAAPSVTKECQTPAATDTATASATQLPPWVARVEERCAADGSLELDVHLNTEAGENVGMADLELEGDATAGLRLHLLGASGVPLELSTPSGMDSTALKAKFRRKTRVLELRIPLA